MIELKEIKFNELPIDQQEILGDYSGKCFSVYDSGELVGSVSLLPMSESYCSVDSVFVEESKRRTGIGTGIAKEILKSYSKIVALDGGSETSKSFFKSMNMIFDEDLKWWELKLEYIK